MSIANQISRLNTAKSDIRNSIIAKGVTVPTDAKLDTYDSYVAQITGGGGGSWTPPADWIDISSVNDNEINLLASDGGVGVAFRITVANSGTYSIDWGDGTIETARASGTIYEHQYTIGSGQSVNNGQYTCFKIRIYGATDTIERYETQRVSGYSRQQYSPLLWAVFGTQGITSYANAFYISGTAGVQCRELVACTIPSFASCTNVSNMLYNCTSLSSLTLPTSWGNVTNVSQMLYNCTSLRILNGIEYLGSQTVQSDFTDILRDAQALTGTITINSLLSKVGIYGASGHNLLCTGIRLLNTGSTFTGSSPQVNVSYTNLDATALNQLFTDLPTLTGKTINITGSLGAGTCDKSIATAKGWTVTG